MAHYYFDIHDGAELDSLDAAVQGAARSAAEFGTGRLARVDTSDVAIERSGDGHGLSGLGCLFC